MFRLLICLLLTNTVLCQDILTPKYADSLYREDQIYVGLTYNILNNTPKEFSPSGFSLGFNFGVLRDFPINKARNVAIAPGIGLGIQRFDHNVGIVNDNGVLQYNVLFTDNFNSNRWTFYSLDFPIEFRWRTSTPDSHKFWRIYGGYKGSFLFYDVSRFSAASVNEVVYNNRDLRSFQSGLYISAGYNTWNFYFYHALNSIFNSRIRTTNDERLNMLMMTFGLQFYIL